MFKSIIIMLGILLTVKSSFGQSKQSLQVVNKYLSIVFAEDKNGTGLSDLLTDDFIFDDPFTTARGAQDFIGKTKSWISTKKTLRMEKQFVDKNLICSIYSIALQTPKGDTETFRLADYIELRDGKISKERVYFFDPVRFAKEMGFLDSFMKP